MTAVAALARSVRIYTHVGGACVLQAEGGPPRRPSVAGTPDPVKSYWRQAAGKKGAAGASAAAGAGGKHKRGASQVGRGCAWRVLRGTACHAHLHSSLALTRLASNTALLQQPEHSAIS